MSVLNSVGRASVILALLLGGCASEGVSPSRKSDLSKEQMLSDAKQMDADGQRLRADGLAKKRQGGGAEADKQIAKANKMITDAKLLKDQAILRDSKVVE